MTQEQEIYIESLRQQAADAYELFDDYQVDYDKFSQVAIGSLLKAEQAQKIYNRIYRTFLYYPNFIKELAKVKDEARAISDKDQAILKEKEALLFQSKSKYDSIIDNLNTSILKYDAEELAMSLQDLANDPNSLIFSSELVTAADDAADAEARAAAKALLDKDLITGEEVCIDQYGKIISMEICRPTSLGGVSASAGYTPSAQELLARSVDNWIALVNSAINAKDEQEVIAKDKSITEQVVSEIKREAEETAQRLENEVLAAKVEEIAQNFDFSVDLSKITEDKKILDKTLPSPRQQNINYALCSSTQKLITVEKYKKIGDTGLAIYLYSGLVGTVQPIPTSIINSNTIKVGQKIRIYKDESTYIVANVYDYQTNGLLFYKVLEVVGNTSTSGFIIETLESSTKVAKYVINNKASNYYGTLLTDYLNIVQATPEEIAIARVSCPNSEFSTDYYSIYNYTGSWTQYTKYQVNDIVNYNGIAYKVTKPIPQELYFNHPENTYYISGYYKPMDFQIFVNNAYCSIGTDGLVYGVGFGWPYELSHQARFTSGAKTWDNFKTTYNITPEQEEIAKKTCVKTTNFVGFDGIESVNKKYNISPLVFLLGGVAAFFIIQSIIKNKK